MFDIKIYNFYYRLRTLSFVQEIAIFGSRSRGINSERSDIDLAITCPLATNEDWQKISSIIDSADTLLKIDYIRVDTLKDERLLREIQNTKKILFQRVPNNYNWYETFLDLGEAIDKFSEIIQFKREDFPYTVEATIQIFEYSFELFWKLLKKICFEEGMVVNSPRASLEQAYLIGLIQDEKVWIEMMEQRNITSHAYKEPTASQIYSGCSIYARQMEKDYKKLKQRFGL